MELDCGIQTKRITAWLDDEISLPKEGDRWVFAQGGRTCRISASPLENRKLAGISLERTLVTVEGDAAAIDAFNRIFTLRFISAGG